MNKKTDNSHFEEKIKLRLENLPQKNPISVLDMYAGTGSIWDEIKKRTDTTINVLGIEKKKINGKIYLIGDNQKYRIDYNCFDIIDLDAYGVPFAQLESIFSSTHKKTDIFVTFIQSMYGQLPSEFLISLGYTRQMIRKIPTLFNKRGDLKLITYLANHGIKKVKIYSTLDHKKNYIHFKINDEIP